MVRLSAAAGTGVGRLRCPAEPAEPETVELKGGIANACSP